MGAEAKCRARFGGKTAEGKALLETSELTFCGGRGGRGGDLRFKIAYAAIRACEADGGTLRVTFPEGTAELDLGPLAAKWAEKIKHPKTLMEKLGVKKGAAVALVGVADAAFRADLERLTDDLAVGRPARERDVVFLGAERRADLARLAEAKGSLKKNGALWVIRPKGRKEITEVDVMDAGRLAGLVDVKVAAFSATHTAEKFVIPVAKR